MGNVYRLIDRRNQRPAVTFSEAESAINNIELKWHTTP